MMTEQRRGKPRSQFVDGSVEVQRKSDEIGKTIEGKLHNLSTTGVQILLPIYPDFSEELELRIHISETKITVEATAAVIWIRFAEDDQCLVGCSFAKALSESVLSSLAQSGINNRRSHRRIETSIPGTARWESDADSIPIRITDYSQGGFCMDSGGPHKAGEAVVVELDAPETDVDLPILGKLCWQTELEGEFSIGCSLMRIEDFEQLRRLGNKPGNKPRKKLSPYLRAAMCVFVLFVSSLLGFKAIQSWRSPPTKVLLAKSERDSITLAVSSETDSAAVSSETDSAAVSSETDSATAGPDHRVDQRESIELEGQTDQIDSDVLEIGHQATPETTPQKLKFVPDTIGDIVGIQLEGDEVSSKSTDTIMEPAVGTNVLAPESEPRLNSTRPSGKNVNSSVSVPHVEESIAPARVDPDDSSVISLGESVGVDRIPQQIPLPIRGPENQDTSLETDVTTLLTPRVKNRDHNNSETHALLAARVNITKVKEAPVVDEVDPDAERKAVAALSKLGAQIEGEGHSVILTNNTMITDADLEHLRQMTSLWRLLLDGTKVTDRGLQHLQGLTSLRTLRLGNTDISDAGLVHIKELTNLLILWLNDTRVADAGLEHLQGLTKLQWLGLSPNITDAGLKHLKGFTRLKGLFLNHTKVTGSGLQHLQELTDLTRLYLNNSRVTDAGLEPLQRMNSLEDLRIHQTRITDKGLDHLKGLTNLKLLFLPARITDAGLEHLKYMTAMNNLGLKGTQVTGPGLRHIKGMTNLKWLWLSGTQVSDDSLAHLKQLNALTMLRLEDTQITDAGLVHLHGMKTLQELYLRNTRVSQEGIHKLKQALPNCKIK